MVKKQEKKQISTDDIIFDDIVFEEDLSTQAEDSSGDNAIKKLRDRLKKCTAEKQEYLDGWQRAKADLINAKKDFDVQKKDFLSYAKSDLIVQIIPVLDSFDMAFANIENVPEEWLKGVKHIYTQFLSILESNGVKQINPVGEKFDVSQHTSVEVRKVDEKDKESIIIEVLQKGYILNNKVIREAKVVVGEYKTINHK